VAEAKVAASNPTPEALKKVELALDREQQLLAQQPAGTSTTQHRSGFGAGNALMMYWLLSGSRGSFAPGAGFRQAGAQAGAWQQQVNSSRSTVSSYAASNPGYRRMVEHSRSTGTPIKSGQSVRGGFGSGSSRTSSGS
jgi:hypothetical protein